MARRKNNANGYDPKTLGQLTNAIEISMEDIGQLHAGIASEIAMHRAEIKDSYAKAKDAGIPVGALKAAVKVRKIERAMEKDVAEEYEQICRALGMLADMPLGQAALAANDGRPHLVGA
jgi:uncharacterized protein (UPF0335 family)